ncbi:MAG: hypothetical protein V1685_01010 [Parcubacteria group bacterium]
MRHKTKVHVNHVARRSVVYRFIVAVLCILALSCGQSAQAGNRTLVYEQAVTCFDSSSFSQSMFFLCWDTYRVDSIPEDRQGIVIYLSDQWAKHEGECVRVTLHVANRNGVDTLVNCCGTDGVRIIGAVPIGSFVVYQHPANDTQWISPSAIHVVADRPWCIVPECLRTIHPYLDIIN